MIGRGVEDDLSLGATGAWRFIRQAAIFTMSKSNCQGSWINAIAARIYGVEASQGHTKAADLGPLGYGLMMTGFRCA
jgi:hypothetical protein